MERNVSHEEYRAWIKSLGLRSTPHSTPVRKPCGCPKECWPAFNKKRQHGQRNIQRLAG